MRKTLLIMFLLVFLLGWTTSSLVSPILMYDKEQPFSFSFAVNKATEMKSPSDHIKEEQIHVYKDEIVLDVGDAIFAKYADTNSMDPLLDAEANGLEIVPRSPRDVGVGDVISYQSRAARGLLVHRVVEKGYDDKGYYFIVKGDNNPDADPEKVRFDQIHGVLIGVIY